MTISGDEPAAWRRPFSNVLRDERVEVGTPLELGEREVAGVGLAGDPLPARLRHTSRRCSASGT